MGFYSVALEEFRDVRVYLPEGYDYAGTERYPVVYFLHGSNPYGYEPYWGMLPEILDDLIATAAIDPVILVTPDGRCPPYRGSYFANSEFNGRFADFTVYDVVHFIDINFRTVADRTGRVVMGHSMGGYGAMALGLQYPQIYCANASLSGPLEMNVCIETRRDSILSEYGGPPYDYDPDAGFWTQATFTQAATFWPNLEDPPYYVHFPLDEQGEVLRHVLEQWRPHNPPYLASQLDPSAHLRIFFDCGIEDEKLEYPQNLAFRDSLDVLGVPYEFQEFHGGHNDQLSARIPNALEWLDEAMEAAADVDEGAWGPGAVRALTVQNPHTGRGPLEVHLAMNRSDRVRVYLLDATGRALGMLFDRHLAAGSHRIRAALPAVQGTGGSVLPSGCYRLCLMGAHQERPTAVGFVILSGEH